MKLLFDFLPIILFFVTFKYAEANKAWAAAFATQHFGGLVLGGVVGESEGPVLLATLMVVAASLAQVAWIKARGRKVDVMLWVSLTLVVVLGGLTIYFHNETFIKWKPTVLYACMALALWGGWFLAKRNFIRQLLQAQLQLPDAAWQHLMHAWATFFCVMAVLNLWVAYHFDTETWVNFKLFGGMGLMIVFVMGQALYLSRHMQDPES